MTQRMVVTEVTQKESGWSVELKTIDSAGEKDYNGFAVLRVPEDHGFRVGQIVDVELVAAEVLA